MNQSEIISAAKACLNHGKANICSLELDDVFSERIDSELIKAIAEWQFVRGTLDVLLTQADHALAGYALRIRAAVRCEADGSMCFEDGDALMADLSERGDLSVQLLHGEDVLFDSQKDESAFFAGKLNWLSWESLEDCLGRDGKRLLARFKKDCCSIIDAAQTLSQFC